MSYRDKTDEELQFDLDEADRAIGQMQRAQFEYPNSAQYRELYISLVDRRHAMEAEIERRRKLTN